WCTGGNAADQGYAGSSAGGPPPALLVPIDDGSAVSIARLGRPGLIIGGMPGITFECAETHLPPGSRLFVFSDGAYEITRPDGSMLWFDEFQQMLANLALKSEHALDALVTALRTLRGGDQFEDDVSVMEIVFR